MDYIIKGGTFRCTQSYSKCSGTTSDSDECALVSNLNLTTNIKLMKEGAYNE